jgi:hypothetical protein
MWAIAREAILADLRTFLREDAAWRQAHHASPAHFEQAFGRPDDGSWDALSLPLNDAELRFHGYIDRIDLADGGARAYLHDYKTGSDRAYTELDDDPTGAGRHIQLALYAAAVRQRLGKDVPVGAAYWFISRGGGFRRIELPEDWSAVEPRLHAVLETVAGGVGAGVFPQVPGAEDDRFLTFANCRYCDYQRVCPSARDEQWDHKRNSLAVAGFVSLPLPTRS